MFQRWSEAHFWLKVLNVRSMLAGSTADTRRGDGYAGSGHLDDASFDLPSLHRPVGVARLRHAAIRRQPCRRTDQGRVGSSY